MGCVLLSRGLRSSAWMAEDGERQEELERAVGTKMPKPVAQLTVGVSDEHGEAVRVHCTPG